MLDDILLEVRKPGRYIGNEWNSVKKDFGKARIKFALCFPDLYEVGMSNLGIRIIYGLLNSIEDTLCERVFSPDLDMEGLLRAQEKEILSLENKRPLREFDLVGFSLAYELDYVNVLNILDLGGIPLKAHLRDHHYPLVIGGGPCTINPEPLHEFFDLFLLGEAEESLLEIIGLYRQFQDKFKHGKVSKRDLLLAFSQIPGVYVPSLYRINYDPAGRITEFKAETAAVPLKIKKRFISDLDQAYFPSDCVIPYIQVVHDRISLEIMRGCPNRCRFCQARTQYFPFRQRKLESILHLAQDSYLKTGYEEISLCGLSVSDYANISELLQELVNIFREKAVSVSLPSLKPKMLVGNLSTLIASIKKTGLTFAPEAGSPRLRNILAKDFDTEEFFQALEQAYLSGYQHVKLYFMIGLPEEKEEDLDSIIDFAEQVSQLRKKTQKGPAQVNISINTLIPKPQTPFQWLAMVNSETIRYKQDYLKKRVRNTKLNFSFHNRWMSILEGVIARGDRRLSQVLLAAFLGGARFDAWQSYFNFDLWITAFNACKIDPYFYLKGRAREEILPWDFIETEISKATPLNEFDKTYCNGIR